MMVVIVGMGMAFLGYHGWRWQSVIRQSPKTAAVDAPRPLSDQWPASKVSFLVAAWNAAADIPGFIEAFQALRLSDKELVLCAGGSDHSFAIAWSYRGPDVTVLEQRPGQGKQRALRMAYPHTTGRLIYLTDIDCRPQDEVVEPLVRAVAAEGYDAATGGIQPLPEQRQNAFVLAQWAIECYGIRHRTKDTQGLRGANAVVSRTALDASGGFHQEAVSGTDYTLAKELVRAGCRIGFVTESLMPTDFPSHLGCYIHKQSRWLRNVLVLGRRYNAPSEVRGVCLTLLFPLAVLILVALGVVVHEFWFLGGLLLIHSLSNRLRYQLGEIRRVNAIGVGMSIAGDFAAGVSVLRQLVWRDDRW